MSKLIFGIMFPEMDLKCSTKFLNYGIIELVKRERYHLINLCKE